MKLWIDDNRPLPSFYDQQAWTVEEALSTLQQVQQSGEPLEIVSFDYDAHAYLDWTFVRIAEWMRDNAFWPKTIRIHTYNWWEGRVWYEKFFAEHAPETCEVDLTNPWDFMDAFGQLELSDAPGWVQAFALEVKVDYR